MKLSAGYNSAFEKTYFDFTKSLESSNLKDNKYCLFYPTIGKDYFINNEIFFVGRAVNYWGDMQWSSIDNRKDVVQYAIDYSQPDEIGQCAIDWVNKDWNNPASHVNHSPFWQVIYKLIEKVYNREDANWSFIMAWSNLYKIAPATGGNPTKKLEWESQLENCKDLFLKEISELNPKNIIMMTGLDWAKDFIPQYTEINDDYVKAICKIEESNVVVTIRPERKPQGPFIENITKYLVK